MRLCKVNDKDAVFHQWSQRAYTVEESLIRGGRPAGQISYPVGIVEYENGTVEEVSPSSIKFTDHVAQEWIDNGNPWTKDNFMKKRFNFPVTKEENK